jgi:hypothetical protein
MISAQTYARYATNPAAFRAELVVDVNGIARRLGEVMNDWQRNDFAAMDAGLMRCSGRSNNPAKQRVYLERGRGHSKTTDLAITCCYAMAFANRPIRGYAFAADKDQAGLLKDAMGTIARLNPWIGEILDIQRNLVVNRAERHPGKGAQLEISASDVGSSYGILPDLIIADELTHWQGDGSLWHSLISSAAKRATCLLVTISNAGFTDSWQWEVREIARTDPAWYFSQLDGPKATWLTDAVLAEQRRMLPAVAYARLWENRWSSGGGDALTPADIQAAFCDDLAPMTGKESGWLFVAGVDLGLTRDCSAVVVLAVPDRRWGKIQLAHNKLWRPTPGRKVNLIEVEQYLLELDMQFSLENVAFDPWQAELLASRLEADSSRRRRNQQRRHRTSPWMREVQPTATNLRDQATLVIEHFGDRRLQLYDCEPLRRDLMKLRVEERRYGMRLTSPRDGDGHGDTFSAFSNALLIGHELSGNRPNRVGIIGSGSSRSPLQQAMERVRREGERLRREHEWATTRDDSDNPIRQWMKRLGRLN